MRNLVLLLASGHTVRVKLRDGDLTTHLGHSDVRLFLEAMPATALIPFDGNNEPVGLIMAYVEGPNDHQRIEVTSPGDAGSAA